MHILCHQLYDLSYRENRLCHQRSGPSSSPSNTPLSTEVRNNLTKRREAVYKSATEVVESTQQYIRQYVERFNRAQAENRTVSPDDFRRPTPLAWFALVDQCKNMHQYCAQQRNPAAMREFSEMMRELQDRFFRGGLELRYSHNFRTDPNGFPHRLGDDEWNSEDGNQFWIGEINQRPRQQGQTPPLPELVDPSLLGTIIERLNTEQQQLSTNPLFTMTTPDTVPEEQQQVSPIMRFAQEQAQQRLAMIREQQGNFEAMRNFARRNPRFIWQVHTHRAAEHFRNTAQTPPNYEVNSQTQSLPPESTIREMEWALSAINSVEYQREPLNDRFLYSFEARTVIGRMKRQFLRLGVRVDVSPNRVVADAQIGQRRRIRHPQGQGVLVATKTRNNRWEANRGIGQEFTFTDQQVYPLTIRVLNPRFTIRMRRLLVTEDDNGYERELQNIRNRQSILRQYIATLPQNDPDAAWGRMDLLQDDSQITELQNVMRTINLPPRLEFRHTLIPVIRLLEDGHYEEESSIEEALTELNGEYTSQQRPRATAANRVREFDTIRENLAERIRNTGYRLQTIGDVPDQRLVLHLEDPSNIRDPIMRERVRLRRSITDAAQGFVEVITDNQATAAERKEVQAELIEAFNELRQANAGQIVSGIGLAASAAQGLPTQLIANSFTEEVRLVESRLRRMFRAENLLFLGIQGSTIRYRNLQSTNN